ncbi:MAG: hypothetical protein IT374_24590 [Polyangiaceae bacterium]|nr:hypothetical protein [Polyangiaceae bacterium]
MPASLRALSLRAVAAATCLVALAHAQAAPDLVRLKDGGVLRGTISEVNAGVVVIVTVAGETRRIPSAQVAYAGPVEEKAPRGPRAMVEVTGDTAPVKIVSSQSDVTLHVRVSSSTATTLGSAVGVGTGGFMSVGGGSGITSGRGYQRVCSAPCDANVATGKYTLALSRGNGAPVEAEGLVEIPGPSTMEVKYTSYSGLRAAGTVVTVVGVLSGLYFIAVKAPYAVTECDAQNVCQDRTKFHQSELLTGIGLFLGGAIIGGVMSSKDDEASIRVVPGAVGALPSRSRWGVESAAAAPTALPTPGLSVSAVF